MAGWFGIVLCSAWQVPDQAGAEADAAPAARGGAAGVETAPGCRGGRNPQDGKAGSGCLGQGAAQNQDSQERAGGSES